MSVYVDDMLMLATVGRITSRWSHLTADTTQELHEFAARLGMRREWFQPAKLVDNPQHLRFGQPRKGSRDHYDLTEGKRALAIKLGAIPCHGGTEPWRRESQ